MRPYSEAVKADVRRRMRPPNRQCVAVTVDRFTGIVDQAIEQTPNLEHRTKQAMSGRLFDEFYKELGIQPDDLIALPYPNYVP